MRVKADPHSSLSASNYLDDYNIITREFTNYYGAISSMLIGYGYEDGYNLHGFS